jgi:hypothetical protein
MVTCFESIESSSGLAKNRSIVSKFIVHSGIQNACVWDSRMHYKFWYIVSLLWKAWWWLNGVETCCHRNILCSKLLCLTEIFTFYKLDKHTGMTNVKLKCRSNRLTFTVLKIMTKLYNFVTLSRFVVDQMLTFLLQKGSFLKLCDLFVCNLVHHALSWVVERIAYVQMCRNTFLNFCLSRFDIHLLRVQTVLEVFQLLFNVFKKNDFLTISCLTLSPVLFTALQAGRSRVRFPMVLLEFFIYILTVALWPWGWLSL